MGRASYKLLRYHAIYALKHDVIGRTSCSSFLFELISAQTRSAFVARETRFPPRIACGACFSGSCSCLQGRDKSWHELVDPEYLLAALDHHDIAAVQQARDLLRFEARRVLMPAENHVRRKLLEQIPHGRPHAVYAIDSRQMSDQLFVIGPRLGAEFQHVAENRDPSPIRDRP